MCTATGSAPLLEQQRQILVPYLPQREPIQTESCRSQSIVGWVERKRLRVHTTSARLRTNIPPTVPSAARPAVELVLPAHGEPTDRAALERVLS
jgi:hypothetical protein